MTGDEAESAEAVAVGAGSCVAVVVPTGSQEIRSSAAKSVRWIRDGGPRRNIGYPYNVRE